MEKMPVFVKVEEYEDAINTLAAIKNKMEAAKTTLAKINQLKQEEDFQLQSWQTALLEIENRLNSIDQFIHEPENY